MVQTAASEAFDTIIFDMQESLQNRKEILEKIASLKSSPKVIVWEGGQEKIADIKSGVNKLIRRPRRQAEILQFIRQSI